MCGFVRGNYKTSVVYSNVLCVYVRALALCVCMCACLGALGGDCFDQSLFILPCDCFVDVCVFVLETKLHRLLAFNMCRKRQKQRDRGRGTETEGQKWRDRGRGT